MSIIDFLAAKVQSFTGEKERRLLVDQIKQIYKNFKSKIVEYIDCLNDVIQNFNDKISILNSQRLGIVKNNIDTLFLFLVKFGNVKPSGSYCPEDVEIYATFPHQQFVKIEDYIEDVDWSKDDIFKDTMIKSIFGIKNKTQKQNLSMREQLEYLEIEMANTLQNILNNKNRVDIEITICQMYSENIIFISKFITEKILPELECVEAFFQTLIIKDKVISGQALEKLSFRNDISLLKDTKYQKHYLFIKNAFVFYVFSCKVYNTDILTRLFKNACSSSDCDELQKHRQQLLLLSSKVEEQAVLN